MMDYDSVHEAADFVKSRLSRDVPKIAMVLGSGLDGVADAVEDAVIIPYEDIPHFPKPTVAGHSGKMLIGMLSGVPVICMRGRVHAYEGHPDAMTGLATRTLWALGVETLVLTNAAGSLLKEAGPGAMMVITDHINFAGVNPLVGLNDDRIGPRFFDMSQAWDPALTQKLFESAAACGEMIHSGVYVMAKGPNFETPAEIEMFRRMGAGAVGMSTVPECLTARHCGMRVCGVSCITNYAAGMVPGELNHEETMEFGDVAGKKLTPILKHFVTTI